MVDTSLPSRLGEGSAKATRSHLEKPVSLSRKLKISTDAAASEGDFSVKANFKVMIVYAMCVALLLAPRAQGQGQPAKVPYGNNSAAGHYLQVDDAKIYYETYGSGGTPLVLLHGGLYGYIEEFGELIGELSKHRRVIAVATRGHGKSELGTKPFSYTLFANDAVAVIHHESSGKVDVLGFSDGAVTSYTLAASHPELVRRLVAIGGPRKLADWTPSAQKEFKNSKPGDVERDSPQFVADRKKLMPDPAKWEEFIERLNVMWSGPVYVTDEQIRSIKVSTLIVAGDHDPYNQIQKFVELYQLLPKGELAIIPGCGHVVLDCKGPFTISAVAAFLDQPEK
jgi:pimeloyl-ACP methyl ester carboxylesterase